MPEIKNTFLKGRMNQDLDSRILPEGEYREAINLLISRSEGSTVGEFENILGNTSISTLSSNKNLRVIGAFTDETNNRVYLFATDFSSEDPSARAASTNECKILELDLNNPNPTAVALVNGHWLNFNQKFPIYGVNLLEELLFFTDNLNQPRRINVTTARNNNNAYTEEMQISVAKYYPCLPVVPIAKTLGTVSSGAANTTTVIELTAAANNVKVGDIVTDFDVTDVANLVISNTLPPVRVVEVLNPGTNTQFRVSPAMTINATPNSKLPSGTQINFTRTTMKNSSDPYVSNYSLQTINFVGGTTQFSINRSNNGPAVVLGGVPRVGDIITITGAQPDDIPNLNNTNAAYRYPIRVASVSIQSVAANDTGIWEITTDKDFTAGGNLNGFAVNDTIAIGNNEDYDSTFKGDSKFIEDKFVRFSYRFKFEDNEYSLMAPFSNVMFMPKQQGQFGLGQINTKAENDINNYYQDETDAYTSTIIEWFENDIDTIEIKIPLPSRVPEMLSQYKVQKIDVLYKESDALAVKVLDTIDLSTPNIDLETIRYNDDVNGLIDQRYYNYNYKSNKPYKTLPQNQTTRVYDKVPIRALAQEVSSNRIIYGNYVEKMTPPASIPYSVSLTNRDMESSNYAAIYPHQTVKQNRTYQVGFVLADYYGRQSDVILSSFDSDNSQAGSSVYVPYRASGEATTTPVLDWLGSNLAVTIDSSFGGVKNFNTGEPGLYYEDNYAASIIAITDGDGGYEANTSYKTTGGSGSGCVVRVTSTGAGGAITGLTIINSGTGYTQGNELTVLGGDGAGNFTINVGVANPLGWYSYKLVIKQQEQEYYNVYLPGFVNGLPINDKVWNNTPYNTGTTPVTYPGSEDIETERNKIFFSTVLSDNINKIPRNLSEVGPTDQEFNSDEILYIRINNPNATDTAGVRNLQYYPGQVLQNVLNIATVKETQLAPVPFQPFSIGPNPSGTGQQQVDAQGDTTVPGFSVALGYQGDYGSTTRYVPQPLASGKGVVVTVPTGSIPWGDVADKPSFYAADQNPFIMKVGQVGNLNNPVGAIVCGPDLVGSGGSYPHDSNYASGVRTMEPILSVAETKPTYSVLELFYETAMSNKLETLNGMIDTNYNGAVRINASSGSFPESTPSGTNVGPAFSFVNGSGAIIPYGSITGVPTITKVYRQNDASQTNVPGLFTLLATGSSNQYTLRTASDFVYTSTSNATPSSDVYIFDLQVITSAGTDDLPGVMTLTLSNSDPVMYHTSISDSSPDNRITTSYNVTPNPAVNDTNIVQLFGTNGSPITNTNNRSQQLIFSIGSLAPGTPGNTSDFSINSTTGLITSNITMANEQDYGLVVNLADANGAAPGSESIERTITWTAGTAFAPKAIGLSQQTASNYQFSGAGNSGEYLFANVPNSAIATSGPFGTASQFFNIKKIFNDNNNVCSGNATANLFQGTIELEPKLYCSATGAGTIAVSFAIQYRANSGNPWGYINSLAGAGLDTYSATSPVVQITKSTVNTTPVTKKYKFDQLGEYRLVTNGLTTESVVPRFELDFEDGSYGTTSNGPCTS